MCKLTKINYNRPDPYLVYTRVKKVIPRIVDKY